MMRIMMLMIPGGYAAAVPGTMPDPAHVAEMGKYNEDMREAGILLTLDGLHPPSVGARVTFQSGKPEVAKGPFPTVKETLGGYWMIRVASLGEAVAWAARCPAQPNDTLEIRQVLEMEDFMTAVQNAAAP